MHLSRRAGEEGGEEGYRGGCAGRGDSEVGGQVGGDGEAEDSVKEARQGVAGRGGGGGVCASASSSGVALRVDGGGAEEGGEGSARLGGCNANVGTWVLWGGGVAAAEPRGGAGTGAGLRALAGGHFDVCGIGSSVGICGVGICGVGTCSGGILAIG